MGCKFSITVDQPRHQRTPRSGPKKTPRADDPDDPEGPKSLDSTEKEIQTYGVDGVDGADGADETESPDRELSSPEQVTVKTVGREYRRGWKP